SQTASPALPPATVPAVWARVYTRSSNPRTTPAALRVFRSRPATCSPPPKSSPPGPTATPLHWSHRRSCSSCIRQDRAPPTRRENFRPSARVPQSVAVARAADDTASACAAASTALPTASTAAASLHRSASRLRWPSVRPPASAQIALPRLPFLDSFAQDLTYALRQLRRNPASPAD